nr:sodium:proline symporter [Candidatus Dadabacteria bacterium]NIT61352.1 sodium:proline symporter [Fodinibius sp.]NIV12023.1 sodium:proline symporter [Fodinibius sp.]NIY29932.1 sodium:proline symporter [Fodinibius sp.]
GTVVTIGWYYIPVLKENLYELIPAFVLSFLATWIVSRFTEKPENIEEAFIEFEK